MSKEKLSPSKETAVKTLYAAFEALDKAGGSLARKEIINQIEKKVKFNDSEKERLKSNGQLRWLTVFLFYTIDAKKSGFLIKEKGTWYLTKEGKNAMKSGPLGLLEKSISGYKVWESENKKTENEVEVEKALEEESTQAQTTNREILRDQALDGIIDYINKKPPYDFQHMVAALLNAMGYYISFNAPKGKDGGIDIIAFQDPLGIKVPRIKVQVKHYPNSNSVGPEPIRSLKGLLNAGEEVGLFVTSNTFSADAKRFSRESNSHIRLIDGEEFIDLWKEHYSKLTDEQKNMLPIEAIYFLGSNE